MKYEKFNPNQIILMNSEQLGELIQGIQEVKALVKAKISQDAIPELLRTPDVKRLLKVGESTLAGLRQNGTLHFTKIGGSIYYLKRDIEKIILENYSGK
ncbi:helix-turn-helix protein [Algoriphagus aquaeductus]|uniref:Helix-turn-helix protein n=1 Tax=Algoriphagus aquaeductus TaxID=475299 RepID=A0A326RKV3_9BACT|nr:helix-turn-helix domain-containing protein [Algoriphagus aquaeductus]PZV79583.1 helix-turn-helix protein [Algoriphagus aquaeductus]